VPSPELLLKQVEDYEKRNPRDLVAESIKSGYNPGSPSFIDIMQYHRGLLHQRGHGWGALAKIAARAAALVIAQVVGGLLGGAQGGAQTGQGIQTGHGAMDYVLNAAIMANHLFGDRKAPTNYFENGKLVSTTKVQSGRGVKRAQKGKGFIMALLKTGAKQALRAAAQTGLDVLDNKRSLKDAIKTHGIRAIKSTAQPLLARGGPKRASRPPTKRAQIKKPPIKRAPIRKAPMNKKPQIKRPAIRKAPMNKKPQIKRPAIRKAPMNKKPAIKRPAIKRPVKRPKRVLDIFD
jgi:hypothetical protein